MERAVGTMPGFIHHAGSETQQKVVLDRADQLRRIIRDIGHAADAGLAQGTGGFFHRYTAYYAALFLFCPSISGSFGLFRLYGIGGPAFPGGIRKGNMI